MADAYCACGRRMSDCDGSRIGCEVAQARFRAGAEAMREAAASECERYAAACRESERTAPCTAGDLPERSQGADACIRRIRALPLPSEGGERVGTTCTCGERREREERPGVWACVACGTPADDSRAAVEREEPGRCRRHPVDVLCEECPDAHEEPAR